MNNVDFARCIASYYEPSNYDPSLSPPPNPVQVAEFSEMRASLIDNYAGSTMQAL